MADSAAFIIHHEEPGPEYPWPIDCVACEARYWTSRENAEAALAAGMKPLCIYCAMLAAALGEEVNVVGGVKDGKVWDSRR
jgi:hypothetical protein